MEMFVVRGGVRLSGRMAVGGAKNAALPIMAAAIAAEGETCLTNVPDLVDVATLQKVLESLGMATSKTGPGCLRLRAVDESRCVADYELVRRMRASICVLGPLLARRRKACVSLPGGCNIGHRPIDLHLKGLEALGAQIRVERGYVFATAKRLKGADIYLGGPFGSTVTGTCNVLVAACLADGTTTISAAACEPEVVDLGCFLQAMGADIEGLGTPVLKVKGVERLVAQTHEIVPDRIEAATLMIAASITGGNVELENVVPEHLAAVMDLLVSTGSTIEWGPAASKPLASDKSDACESTWKTRTVRVSRQGTLRPADCTALPYPGVPTDVQAQVMALLSLADGISVVTDKVFPDRFMHIPELVRLGARIRREGSSGIVHGVQRLSGASVMASDLRASAALLLAALAASGESTIRRIYHLDRGYERLDEKLKHLGARIHRVQDTGESADAVPGDFFDSQPDPSDTSSAIPHPHLKLTGQNLAANEALTGDSSKRTSMRP